MEFGNRPVRVLLVPADRTQPLRSLTLAADRFEVELGGRPEPVLPNVSSAPPAEWMLFVAADARGRAPVNTRAQLLSSRLGGVPGRTLHGTVLFTGCAPGQRIRGVPGLFAQLATLLGLQVRSVE